MKCARPLGNRVIAVKEAAPETTEGGLVIPEAHREAPAAAIVTSTGPSVKGVCIGDQILFQAYSGRQFNIHGQDVFVVDVDDIMVVLVTDDALQTGAMVFPDDKDDN